MTDWLPYEDVHGRDHSVSGTVLVWPQLASEELDARRDICVYLPPSLGRVDRRRWRALDRRYPVLYFHDGQNVFDERTSFAGEWCADETLEQLAGEGLEAIAVAVANGGEARMDEYNPWREKRRWKGRIVGGKGDAYLEWLVGTVKPLIDRSFPTQPDRMATGVIGSSMGGLISMYALVRHAGVFGLAGVMSPSLRWNGYAILDVVEQSPYVESRVHLDGGGREWRGLTTDLRRLREMLVKRGWRDGVDLNYVEDRYAGHNEPAWARRLPDALRFLLADFGGAPTDR